MADNTPIEWTDATWNPITGCSIVSKGCTNCYAMLLAGTRLKNVESRKGLTREVNGKHVWTGEVRLNEAELLKPLQWRRPRKIFVCAHGDLFAENVPDEWIDKVFAVMALAPQHTFQVLTKRPERMRDYLKDAGTYIRILQAASEFRARWQRLGDIPISDTRTMAFWPHVWLGTSVEDQPSADARIPVLLDTPAAIRWISAEPLLGLINLTNLPVAFFDARENALTGVWKWADGPSRKEGPGLDWVVVGGESGASARPMHPDWARALRDQCAAAGVPFLFKQWGSWVSILDRDQDDPDWRANYSAYERQKCIQFLNLAGGTGFHGERLHVMLNKGKKAAGRHLDGVLHDAYPSTSRMPA